MGSDVYGALSVTPAAINNDYVGSIGLAITGLNTPGQTVIIEEFFDSDASNSITAADLLLRKILVTDGAVTTVGGRRNLNISGDEDAAANGQIQTLVYYKPDDIIGRGNGKYLFRVSPSGVGFTPFTASLTVNQKDYGGSGISGTVKAGSVAQAGALVLVLDASSPDGEVVGMTQTSSSGAYSLKMPAGRYTVIASKSGLVCNMGAAAPVVVNSGSFASNKNVAMTARARKIMGMIRDSGPSHGGLPALPIFATSQSGFVSVTFSDAAGNFTVDATDEPWSLEVAGWEAAQLGFLTLESHENSSVDVAGFNIDLPKATALIYGTIKTPANVAAPFAPVEVEANGDPNYKSAGISDAAGNYSLGVLPGSWRDRALPKGMLVHEQMVVVNTDGAAVSANHLAHPVNAHLRGQIRDNHGNIVPNLEIIARDPTLNGAGEVNAFAVADANGNFDIAVYGGGGAGAAQPWSLQLLERDENPTGFVSTQPQFQVQDGVDINGITYLVYAVTSHLRGQVVDENDAPIGHINVYANGDNGNLNTGSGTDENGYFDVAVFGGSWQLGLSNINGLGLLPQNMILSVTDGVDQEGIVFRAFHATGGITGTVKDSASAAIAGIEVTATTTISGSTFAISGATDSGGNYSLSVPAGTWVVGIDAAQLINRGFRPALDQNAFVNTGTVPINFVATIINPGEVESGFDPNVSGDADAFVWATAVQPDGKILIGGNFSMVGTTPCTNLARLEADGSVDSSFNPGVSPDGAVFAILVQPDGKILIGGAFDYVAGHARSHVARLEADGAVEDLATFDPGSGANDGEVYCLGLQADGKILVGGAFTQFDGQVRKGIARLYANGALETTETFNPGTGADEAVYCLAIQADAKILLGGPFTGVNGQPRAGIARLNADGTVEGTETFDPGTGADAEVACIALQADGKILLGGNFTHVDGQVNYRLARLRSNGTVEGGTDFNPGAGADDAIVTMAVQADGKILLGGRFAQLDSQPRHGIARLLPNGQVEGTAGIDFGLGADAPIAGLALRADGGILAVGGFGQMAGKDRNRVAAFGNNIASQALAIPNSSTVHWLRGGSAPEVESVAFEVSMDDGLHWSPLGPGVRMPGGWQLASLDLPLSGTVRAIGLPRGGVHGGSAGIIENQTRFALGIPAPEIAVFEGLGTDGIERQDNAGVFDFGTIGVNTNRVQTFTILNAGTASLNSLAITEDGADAAAFVVNKTGTAGSLSPRGVTTFTVQFTPTSLGSKSAVLHVLSNDSDESSFEIVVQGAGTAAVAPTATTLAAGVATVDQVTVNGTVNAKGSTRDVFFDYGLTTSYGASAPAAQSPVNGDGTVPVSATLTGLLPHKKYNYRVRASGALGSANGGNMIFNTANRVPEAQGDSFAVLPGAKATLGVLTNDTDLDGDVLSIASFTPLTPASAGTLAKVNNTFVFTASPKFNGAGASFTYKAADGFGGTSASVAVNLSLGTCALEFDGASLSSAGVSYSLGVTASGTWSVIESLPWVTVSPVGSTDSSTLIITVQPNSSKVLRTGVMTIGGQSYTISQDGVQIPELTDPSLPLDEAIVSEPYFLQIETNGAPVSYTVTQMPPGLKIDSNGLISGTPTKAGTYSMTVKAANAAGPSNIVSFSLEVKPLPAGVVGSFQGFIARHPGLNGNLGSRLEITTTATGAYTGKIITGTTATALKGQLLAYALDSKHPELMLAVPRKGLPPLALAVTFSADDNVLDGSLGDGSGAPVSVSAWRNAWNATDTKATPFALLHAFSLEASGSVADTVLPQGYGYGSFTVKETTGALTVTGKLADGSALTTTTFLGQQGQVLIYQPLYTNRGSVAGILTIKPGAVEAGDSLTWFKDVPLANSKDTMYRDGFGPVDLGVEGGPYVPPAKGGIVMQLDPPANNDNAQVFFSLGGLDVETATFDLIFGIANPSPTGLTNKATLPTFASGGNPNKVNLPTLTPATGLFSGDFTLGTRKVPFQGQIIPTSAGLQGRGFFLLPESTASTAIKHSGRVELKAK